MPLIAILAACSPSVPVAHDRPLPTVTDVAWTTDGVENALADGEILFGTASSTDGSCESTTRIQLVPNEGHSIPPGGLRPSSTYTLTVDLAAYADGAAVITPAAPFGDRPPTFAVFAEDPYTFWSGGPATFTIDPATFQHTLTLQSPTLCTGNWHEVDVTRCVESGPVTIAFTGRLDERVACAEGFPGDEPSPSGVPYCVGEDWVRCE